MAELKIHLSVNIGPVQGFVAQARRTRDLWAGSWLLSYLAECALAAAEEAGGEAIIPHRETPGTVSSVQSATGGIPNRFELTFDNEAQAQAGAAAADNAFQEAWQTVAEAVRKKFVEPVADQGWGTRDIWDRQVNNFWELSWVIGSPEGDERTVGRLAAARKALRNVHAAAEPGIKCSLMSDLQEVSGCTKGNQQRDFWSALRDQISIGGHDIGDSERLCAIALIKRLFPKVSEQALGERAREANLAQLKEQVGWPSTAFFAAQPWLRKLADEHATQAAAFGQEATNAQISMSEKQAAKETGLPDWAGLDAPVWFRNTLQQNEWGVEPQQLKQLSQRLRCLHEVAGIQPIPYYALLLMDGDSMGALLGKLSDPRKLSNCLGTFTGKAGQIVASHGGRTVYAGGDDVLAMLPAKDALDAADKLSCEYRKCFGDTDAKDAATLSGAIVYVHWKFPLRQVLETAHHLLDGVAKDQTGRDALAIGAVKGSGLNAVWSAPWPVVRGKEGEGTALRNILREFGDSDTEQEEAAFNASYLYHLREQFGRLFETFRDEPGRFETLNSELASDSQTSNKQSLGILGDIAHAEYRRRMSIEDRKNHRPAATQPRIERLMSLSRRWRRTTNGNGSAHIGCDWNTFSFDGWRLARFLKKVHDGKTPDHD